MARHCAVILGISHSVETRMCDQWAHWLFSEPSAHRCQVGLRVTPRPQENTTVRKKKCSRGAAARALYCHEFFGSFFAKTNCLFSCAAHSARGAYLATPVRAIGTARPRRSPACRVMTAIALRRRIVGRNPMHGQPYRYSEAWSGVAAWRSLGRVTWR